MPSIFFLINKKINKNPSITLAKLYLSLTATLCKNVMREIALKALSHSGRAAGCTSLLEICGATEHMMSSAAGITIEMPNLVFHCSCYLNRSRKNLYKYIISPYFRAIVIFYVQYQTRCIMLLLNVTYIISVILQFWYSWSSMTSYFHFSAHHYWYTWQHTNF